MTVYIASIYLPTCLSLKTWLTLFLKLSLLSSTCLLYLLKLTFKALPLPCSTFPQFWIMSTYTPFDLSTNSKTMLPFILFCYLPWDLKSWILSAVFPHSLHSGFTLAFMPAFSKPTASTEDYSLSGTGPHESTQCITGDNEFVLPTLWASQDEPALHGAKLELKKALLR